MSKARSLAEKKVKEDLLKVLTRIHQESASDFAVGGVTNELPSLPGIKISDYGTICLPLTDIEDLKQHFEQAPFGLGEDTVVDTAVRNSLQLDPDKFEITNPNFVSSVNSLVKKLSVGLGCQDVKVTSHLYKLLLYAPGGHFKPHRDTEKFPGMFATLIIQVPSVFTGGDLVVKHGDREKRIEFSTPEAQFSCVYAAHSADCEHELTEVTSGYRLALVYSLCWDGNGVAPSPPNDATVELASLLKQVNEIRHHPSKTAWGLDHHYSEHSLSNDGVQALKGGDKLLYSTLQGANGLLDDENQFDFYIVKGKRTDHMSGVCEQDFEEYCACWFDKGPCESFEMDDCETTYKFQVVSINDKQCNQTRRMKLRVEDNVLNIGRYEEEFWGECHIGKCQPTGNEGTTKKYWYQRFLLVAVPKEDADDVLSY